MSEDISQICKVVKVHDDGDLSIECRDKKYLVTTEGDIYGEVKTRKAKYQCWFCGVQFNPPADAYHEVCKTYRCPNGHCFCSLSKETQMALDRAMASYGLWEPFGNPCRRK